MRPTRIVAVANQKGGVGKTTTCVNLAAALVELGKKVLLIDNDAQANLTSYLEGKSPETSNKSTCDELYLMKRCPTLQEAKERFLRSYQISFDYIAANRDLAGVEFYLYTRPEREKILRTNLAWANGEYDFILIDNPPSLNLLTLNALTAATEVLIPVQTQFFSLEGVQKMQESIELVRSRWNPELKIAGILPTQIDYRKKLTTEVLALLGEHFKGHVFGARIRDNSKLAESTGYGKTILAYAPSSAGSEDYRSLADEFVEQRP
ncbi:MAG: ParA family protein [Bdellovibrionota bacterium]